MGIKINIQDTFIPVELGELDLKFYYNDESLFKIKNELTKYQKEMAEIDETGLEMEEIMVLRNKVLKQAYDTLFEEGTYDKIWEMSPSTMVVYSYFTQIIDGIITELDTLGVLNAEDVAVEKYIQSK